MNHTCAAANDDDADDDADVDNGYYQFPLPVEQICWVDSTDAFCSCVSHIAQVWDKLIEPVVI